jgi:hypothetical protein
MLSSMDRKFMMEAAMGGCDKQPPFLTLLHNFASDPFTFAFWRAAPVISAVNQARSRTLYAND